MRHRGSNFGDENRLIRPGSRAAAASVGEVAKAEPASLGRTWVSLAFCGAQNIFDYVNWVRRIVSVVLILGLALGTTGRGAQPGMMAGMHQLAAAVMNHDGMPGCDGCINTGDTGKGMAMAGCQGGVCVVLPGLLPSSVGTISLAADAFVAITLTAPSGLAPPPDHPPPISASLT